MILTTSFYDKLEEDNKKRLLPKFQFIPIFHLQVMNEYVYWYCSIDHCVLNSRTREFQGKLLLFDPEMIYAHFLWGNVFLRGVL